jgi:HemY protein
MEAERVGEREAARQFAERALRLNPRLGWPVEALFDLQCRAADWQGALETLASAERQRLLDKSTARRRRAVLLTAQAHRLEDDAPDRALDLALEAHGLARDLVPAAAVAGRILAARGKTPKAARVLLRTWRRAPHPDLAVAYAYARPGDSPRDRLDRVRHLARLTPNHPEALIAVAASAIEARAWDAAREALKPLLDDRLTPRVCALMARIEGEQYRDAGRAREWLARAAGAARDPAWMADGVAYARWGPVSPATGRLDAMRWAVPEAAPGEGAAAAAALAARLESLPGPGTPSEVHVEAPPQPNPPARPPPTLVPSEPAAPAKLPPATSAAAPVSPGPASASPPSAPVEAARSADAATPPAAAPALEPPVVSPRARPRKPAEPKIFVSPRAPDDPGTDTSGIDDLTGYPTKA